MNNCRKPLMSRTLPGNSVEFDDSIGLSHRSRRFPETPLPFRSDRIPGVLNRRNKAGWDSVLSVSERF